MPGRGWRVLLFAPDEAGNVLMPGLNHPALVQLLGGALVGYAIANWTARGGALGGIYGRAVVAGNQAHLMIGGCCSCSMELTSEHRTRRTGDSPSFT